VNAPCLDSTLGSGRERPKGSREGCGRELLSHLFTPTMEGIFRTLKQELDSSSAVGGIPCKPKCSMCHKQVHRDYSEHRDQAPVPHLCARTSKNREEDLTHLLHRRFQTPLCRKNFFQVCKHCLIPTSPSLSPSQRRFLTRKGELSSRLEPGQTCFPVNAPSGGQSQGTALSLDAKPVKPLLRSCPPHWVLKDLTSSWF
jgi:hypothetical protein